MSTFEEMVNPFLTRQAQLIRLLDKRKAIDIEAVALMLQLNGQWESTQSFVAYIDGFRLLAWYKSQAVWCQELAEYFVTAQQDVQRIIEDYGRLAQLELEHRG